MTIEQFAKYCRMSAFAVIVLGGIVPSPALADSGHDHGATSPQMTPEQERKTGALVAAVRETTERFKDVNVAGAEGYSLQFGCVSGSGDEGAMGLHFVNGSLIGDGQIDLAHPEIILYEPQPDGTVKLTGADYLVLKADWDAKHQDPPQLMGQLFHLFDSPNRFGLPPFYTLHVWAWKNNPNGTFTNWNPTVTCDAFAGQRH